MIDEVDSNLSFCRGGDASVEGWKDGSWSLYSRDGEGEEPSDQGCFARGHAQDPKPDPLRAWNGLSEKTSAESLDAGMSQVQ